jgi:hypothetical protein
MHGRLNTLPVTNPQGRLLRAAALSESVEAYPHVRLNAGWRVIVCRDGIQWVLQARNGTATVSSSDWRGRSYCRTREALIRCSDLEAGAIDPAAAAVLAALPWRIGEPLVERAPASSPMPAVPRRPNLQISLPAGSSAMQAALLRALERRTRDPRGWITLPTGKVKAAEVGQVLGAIARAQR